MRCTLAIGARLAVCAAVLISITVDSFSSSTLRRTSIFSKLSAATSRLHYSDPATPVIQIELPVIENKAKPLKLGVLLLNLGGPETMEDVEGFLYNLFADPDIIRLPTFLSLLQKPIAYAIAKRRAPKSSAAYLSIGGGSPIVKYTKAQADLIEASLISKGLDAKCYFAMRYWNPYTEEVLEQMEKDGINTMVVIPLYPQYSISTSGSSLKLLEDIFNDQPEKWGPEKVTHTVVPAWYFRPGYVQCMASLIVKEIEMYTPEEMKVGLHVLFSAHGVPESYIEAGDPYQRHIEECVRLISTEVSNQLSNDETRPAGISKDVAMGLVGTGSHATSTQFHLSFQSRVGPVQWLQPYTEEVLEELGESGVKNLIVVPVSFVSEHIETLEEIDMEYRELAEKSGIVHWRRVPALNTDKRFIADMADMVVEALEAPALSVSEAASQNAEFLVEKTAVASQIGLTMQAEMLNGRLAMMGILGTTVFEIISGHPVVQMVGLR